MKRRLRHSGETIVRTATYIGAPCKFGHSLRRVSNGMCAVCANLRARTTYEEDRRQAIVLGKCIWCKKAVVQGRLQCADHLQRTRERERKRNYGLTADAFAELLRSQNHRCKICLVSFSERESCVDHDHITGYVRGLLCHQCNRGLGAFCDNRNSLLRAVRYLRGELQ